MSDSKLSADAQFFFEHAGFAYDREKETPEQGRTRGALNLAAAEAWARAAGVCFNWVRDDTPGEWACIAYDHTGTVCGSLGEVDFGADGVPWGDTYRRVVEAEMAAEIMVEVIESA